MTLKVIDKTEHHTSKEVTKQDIKNTIQIKQKVKARIIIDSRLYFLLYN